MDQSPGQQLAVTAITAALLAAVMWWQIPEWQRAMITRSVKLRAWKILHRLARASGRRAMGDELTGRMAEAEAGYAFTERLSRARDAL